MSAVIRGRWMRSGGGGLCLVLGLLSTAACGADAPLGVATADAVTPADLEVVTSDPPADGRAPLVLGAAAAAAVARTDAPDPVAGRSSPGCDTGASIEGGVHVRRWYDVDRQVIVRLPVAAGPHPLPVVFNLHGSAADASSHEAFLDLSAPAVQRGYVVLTPEGMPPAEGQLQVWELFPGIYPDDPGYLASLVDWIGEVMCVDLDRIYATGFSNGSTMTNVLACHTGGRFRAIGAVAAHRFPIICPSGAVSVLGIHGTADQIVPYLGGPLLRRPEIWMPPVEETFDQWAQVGGCDLAPRYEVVVADVVRRTWNGCADGVQVVLYSIGGGGHSWPRVDDPLDPGKIDATTLILDFFDAN
jgi:polyhydroxybutyrate depolymerase